MRLRRWAYRRGLLPSRSAPVGVISVGNLTAGGTGKTPMVAWIVRLLQASGRKPAVVMRGYRSRAGRSDEATLLKQLTGAEVVVNPDRLAGAVAAAAAGADVIVLDDAFQHRRLRRDLDIVLIDATDPFGLGHCLPRGLLREPAGAIRDAHAIVITRSDAVAPEGLQALRRRLGQLAPQASIALAVHRVAAMIDPDGRRAEPSALSGRSVFAFCGIGNPEHFRNTLARLGVRVVGSRCLGDHVHYSAALLTELCEQARQCGCELMITTQKDYVKIDPGKVAIPLWQLAIEIDVVEGRDELLGQLVRMGQTVIM
jgi:tetraacyldisaccharide 4'-kinase